MNTIWRPEINPATRPKYKAVAEAIRDAIETGALQPGDKLPPVRELGWQLGMTPGTVARAYSILTDETALSAVVGRGTFVAERQADTGFPTLMPDPVQHNEETTCAFRVNMFSPGLARVGQHRLVKELLAQVAACPASGIMHYPTWRSARPAREAALHWLGDSPLGPLDADDLVVTMGGQHGIVLVMQAMLTGRRPVILVEEMCYPGFRRAAELARAEVVALPMDDQGIIPDAFEAAVKRTGAQLLCTSPEVHNPTTLKTPMSRRHEILSIARAHGVHILEDDCYLMGAERDDTYRKMAPELGWYVTSISKTVTPAVRLGAVVPPVGMVPATRRAYEHGMFGLPTPMLDLAALLLTDPRLPAMQQAALDTYGRYIASAVSILDGFDVSWRQNIPFLWLQLPNGWRASTFCRAAEAADAPVRSAEEFMARDAKSPHAVRIAINAVASPESFDAAIGRLRALLDNPSDEIGV